MLIGVTGGMGSGKSSLARLFAAWGAVLIDADQVTHRVLERPEVIARLQAAFGEEVVGEGGVLDRPEVARRAFASAAGWQRLNQIVRPPVAELLWAEVERAVASGGEMVVVDAPLIFEWGSQERFDAVVVVDADEALRVERVKRRSKLSEAEIRQRLAYQMPAAEKKRRADFVVDNSGDPEELRRQAEEVWRVLQQRRSEILLTDQEP